MKNNCFISNYVIEDFSVFMHVPLMSTPGTLYMFIIFNPSNVPKRQVSLSHF